MWGPEIARDVPPFLALDPGTPPCGRGGWGALLGPSGRAARSIWAAQNGLLAAGSNRRPTVSVVAASLQEFDPIG